MSKLQEAVDRLNALEEQYGQAKKSHEQHLSALNKANENLTKANAAYDEALSNSNSSYHLLNAYESQLDTTKNRITNLMRAP